MTFGAVTVMQVVGHDRGLILMERSDPLFLLVSLPLVPVGLVLGKMVRWEDSVSEQSMQHNAIIEVSHLD